ncbi:hypothetical protein [Actinacidiphila paucisporea]|uniref:hypothetical protein n=1 Tax=Actinacidiphila paucisporea TaxID=310782 RepID=UPI001160FB84|nr:hypothetical protein [Actinacidiphila paucisporea]
MTLDDWRPVSFLVVAQFDVTVQTLEDHGFTVELDEAHGEHTAVLRLHPGLLFCLVATPGTALGGFVLLVGDQGETDWEEARLEASTPQRLEYGRDGRHHIGRRPYREAPPLALETEAVLGVGR